MTSSRPLRGLIRADSTDASAVNWRAPDVAQSRAATLPARELEDLRAQARHQGHGEGHAAGLKAAARDVAARCAAVEQALDVLARPLEDCSHRVEEEILALVQAVVRQVLRREVQLDATHIIGVIREGIAALPLATANIGVRLHPADAEVVRNCVRDNDGDSERDRAWHIETDPLMERGGCVISTDRSVIDARLDARVARAMAVLVGDERHDHG